MQAGELTPDDAPASAPRRLPPDLLDQWSAVVAQPHSLRTTVAERAAWEETTAQVGGQGSLGDTPLVVIAADLGPAASMSGPVRDERGLSSEDIGQHETLWRHLQEDLVNWSSDGRLVVAEGSTHRVYLHEPGVVLEGLRGLTR